MSRVQLRARKAIGPLPTSARALIMWLALICACAHFVLPAADAEPAPASPPIELTWHEKAWLAKHHNIRVGAETNYAPYEFKDADGKFTGIIADYLDIIKHKLDVQFQVSQLRDFATVEDKLRKRELDVILAVAPSAEREQFLVFTKPYLHYVNVIVTRDNYSFVSSLRDFGENRVAVVEGHSSKQLAARVYPNYNVASYPDLLDGLMAVSTGQVDGLVDDIFPIVYMIRQRRISNLKIATAVDKSLQPVGFAVGVRRDWPELAGILDKVLANISHDQEREISQKWLSVRYENKVDYRAIWTSVSVFSAILLAAVLWIRQLSGQRRALMAARAEAEAAARAKDHFLANMSHELRTPLHAILGYADLVREGKLAEASRQEALGTIARSGQHLLSLINDLLDLSRIRSGHLEMVPAPVPLRALLEEIAAMVRVDAQQKGLDFFLRAAPNLPAVVKVDGRRLRQILLNLLGNAIKFTEKGSVTLAVESTPVDEDQIELRVSVRDTGVGIAPKDLARIFAPFEQAEGQRREAGAGLGLAISRELANGMGGSIEVDSQPGGGSDFRFSVTLPVVHEQQPAPDTAQRIVGYEGRRLTVLAVDDQPENRMLLRQMLEPLGFQVELAADGQEALAAARKQTPDLVVMDLRMPGTDGFDAAHAIRRSPHLQRVAIVAASASGADLERAEADHDTFSECLRKPFQTSELLEVIGHVLAPRWRYAGAEPTPDAASSAGQPQSELLAPERTLVEELLELARMGMLVRVEQIALDLEKRDPRYTAFARRVYSLAHSFEEEALVALLQRCLEARSDVTAD